MSTSSPFSLLSSIWGWLHGTSSIPPSVLPSKRVVLIDGNNILHHKYDPACTKSASYVHLCLIITVFISFSLDRVKKTVRIGATLGFLDEIEKALDTFEPHRIGVVFDPPRQVTPRKRTSKQHKHQGGALRPQFSITATALQRLGIAVVQVPTVRADDLIASYTKASVADDFDVVIVSNDTDFYQLLSPHVVVFNPSRGHCLRDTDEIFGLPTPTLQLDLMTLVGSKWGKAPGLPGGLGRDEAVALLVKSNGLLQLLDRLEEFVSDDPLRDRLAAAATMLRETYLASKLDDSLLLPLPLDDFSLRHIKPRGLSNMVKHPKLLFKKN
ncbi:Aste57867_12841 [Aphanomyces stellatus]|uniref:Aste57867_12841 protein n=1 Tax=Aphanomyces stellatus TaxID=120398 RepID=A0A485KXE8_9STRA|nr:hypothetical protein As57867_012793 [Aphanomyces stellatus]VFT89688.1 Aste57867_12841 [Aphanomyces stellatus]